MDFEKRENITLIVVLIISAVVFGTWGINKLTRPPEEQQERYARNYYYKCSVEPYNWPDLIMELEFKESVSEEKKETIANDFYSLYNAYNEKAENPIHYMDVLDPEEDDKVLSIYIDFGNADIDALEMFLDYLNRTTVDLKKVAVY